MAKLNTCSTCIYYSKIEGVCCNGHSMYCADFVDAEHTCCQHELTDNLAKFYSMMKALGYKEKR